jgi:hypothetical protein
MADLIDRQKIKAKFEPWLKVKGYSEGELNMLKAVLYEITIMPSTERHGTWLPYLKEGLTVKCSECGSRFDRPWHYCPNCGVRMELE